MPLVLCKGGLSFNVSEADVVKQVTRHGKPVTQAKVPLSRLDEFVNTAIGNTSSKGKEERWEELESLVWLSCRSRSMNE